MKTVAFILSLMSALLLASAGQAASGVAAAPMHTEGATPTWPRLTKLGDARIMARVNALLAAKEKEDRRAKADCYQMVKEAKQKVTADTYSTEIDISYLSSLFMTVKVVTSYDCAAAYPTSGMLTPYTVELTQGAQMDWNAAFKPNFLSADGKTGTLTKLYRAHYQKLHNTPDDKDCVDVVTDSDPFESATIVYLDQKRGVVFQPDFPHVVAACADDFALSPAQIAPYLKNVLLAGDLKAMVGH